MKKKLWMLVSVVILCCVTLAVSAGAAVWDGTAASGFDGGTGTEDDPYRIATAEQLAYLAESVNSGTTYAGEYVRLTADIVLNDPAADNWTLTAKKWTPIGTYTDETANAPFSGTFDGGNHTIRGLYIQALDGTTWIGYQGLFGYTYNAELMDVTIADADITGADNVGALVGYARYYVEYADAAYTISGCTVKDAKILGESYVGGIAGEVYKDATGNSSQKASLSLSFDTCINENGNVQGEAIVGGLVGYDREASGSYIQVSVTFTGCTNIGEISCSQYSYYSASTAGGIVGYCYSPATFTECTNSGVVSAASASSYASIAGGIAGDCYSTATFIECTNSGNVSASTVGGIVGYCYSTATFIKCTNSKNVSEPSYSSTAGGIAGECHSIAIFTECTNSGNISASTAGGIVGYCYNTAIFTECINSGNVSASSYASSWAGGILGAGSNTTFTECTNSGNVSASSDSSNSTTPYSYAGGITGNCDTATFMKCTNSGDISSNSASTYLATSSYSYAGGITGNCLSTTTFTECTNTGNITTNSNSSYRVTSSNSYAGGIAGVCYQAVTFTECTNYGMLTSTQSNPLYAGGIAGKTGASSTIENCYNTGSIVTSDKVNGNIGGIVGYIDKSVVRNCYNTGSFYGTTNVGGIFGYVLGGENKAEAFVYNCYNLGSVNGIKYSSSTPASYIGGVIGQVSGVVHVAACYYLESCASDDLGNLQNGIGSEDCTVPAADIAGMTVSCTDAQMQQQSTYAGFDFTEIWTMGNSDYPYPVFLSTTTVSVSAAASEIDERDSALVTVTADKPFTAAELTLTYDPDYLTFDPTSSTLSDAEVSDIDGVLTIADYGAEQTQYTLAFTAVQVGTTEVKLTSAAFGDVESADKKDLREAEIETGTVSFIISEADCTITLPSDILSGNDFVEYGQDYTFAVTGNGQYYDYTVTAEITGETVDVIDNGDGTYTVENVTGALVITAERTPKTFSVTFRTTTDVILPENTAQAYGTDYSFTMPAATYIAEAVYGNLAENVPYSTDDNGVVTIPGTAIIDDISIKINYIDAETGVTVIGSGASDAVYEPSAAIGKVYTLTVNKDPNYDYAVTAEANGKELPLTESDGTYTISGDKVTEDAIVFTITKTLKTDGISVDEYLTLDGTSLWLITNAVEKLDGMVYCHDGTAMFWSEAYNAYCTVVVSSDEPVVNAETLSLKKGTAASVSYEMDVNKSGKVDANDAQFIYNMYNCLYSGITESVTAEKYLRADVNGDGIVNTQDSAAVIHHILSGNTPMLFAHRTEPSFHFALEVDGSSEKTVKPGDIITFAFRISRTDSTEDYLMYAMQNEIRYDSAMLELVEDSIMVKSNIVTTDILSGNSEREFYMNSLSKSGEDAWPADTLVGFFRMKVIGTGGTTTVSCQDCSMSRASGMGSYPVTYSDVTLTIAEEQTILGDVNGDNQFTKDDLQYLAKYWAGCPGYSIKDIPLEVLDVDSDGTVTRRDAMILERHFAGWKGYETLPLVKP